MAVTGVGSQRVRGGPQARSRQQGLECRCGQDVPSESVTVTGNDRRPPSGCRGGAPAAGLGASGVATWLTLCGLLVSACSSSAHQSVATTSTSPAASSIVTTASTTTAEPASTTLVTQLPPPAKTCGVERWAVKTGMDADAAGVDLRKVVSTTIEAMTAIPPPPSPTARVAPTEKTVFSIRATLTKFNIESDDSDYHLVIDDGQGRTMIAEIPSTDCIGVSPFKGAIGDVRAVFFTQFHPRPSFTAAHADVTVTGVGFFDRIHGQTGVAPNGIELHPVLSLTFG